MAANGGLVTNKAVIRLCCNRGMVFFGRQTICGGRLFLTNLRIFATINLRTYVLLEVERWNYQRRLRS